MIESTSVPPHLDPKYLCLLEGVCPNTGERCTALGVLRFNAEVSRDSFAMGAGEGFSFDAMTAGQREAYDRHTAEAQQRAETIQQVLGGKCIDSCAPQATL
ncbi:MAG TPA: hypothetical protein VLG16_01060 [Candidatus Saccharimonadales bacterium]|nr:hypothetical protein [Candidatus Saccharimonadales bacterium]